VLGLAGQQVSPSLQDELDLFCDPGVSFGIYHGSKVVGGGFCLAVPGPGGGFAGGGGDFIPASAWHSAAARLATESEDPAWLWRRAQLVHLTRLCGWAVGEARAQFGLHLSCLALDPSIRGAQLRRPP